LAISSRRVSSTHASSVSFGINLSGRARDVTPAFDGLSTRPRPALAARRWAKPFSAMVNPTVGQAHRAAPEALRREICSPSLRPHQTDERVMSTQAAGFEPGTRKIGHGALPGKPLQRNGSFARPQRSLLEPHQNRPAHGQDRAAVAQTPRDAAAAVAPARSP